MKHYTLSYMEDGEIKILHFEVTKDKEEQFFQAMSNPICRQMFEYGKGKITHWQLEEGKPTVLPIVNLELSIKALHVYGVKEEIINDMLYNLKKLKQ